MIGKTIIPKEHKYPNRYLKNEISTGGFLYPSDGCIDVSDYDRCCVRLEEFCYVVIKK